MTDRLNLLSRHRKELETLLRKHVPDAEVWAYGSRVNGQSHDASDLDLALRGPNLEPLGSGYADLLEALEQSNIPILVQAHDWARLPGSFHREIERDYVVVQEMAKPTPSNGWREMTLGKCAELVRDSISPDGLEGTLYIGLEHIGEGTLSLVGSGVASEVSSVKSKFRSGDILFGKLRPYFRKVVRPPFDGICSTDVWVIRPKDGVDPKFLYYVIASEEFVDFANAGTEGTRMPRAIWEYATRFEFPLPPLPEQRAIARILGALDDKIELNRRMNQTLEQKARAIFQDWFVDFGPVRAKLEGREPYLPPELWALFPDRLVDSELGEIPEGWEVGNIGDVAHQRREGVKPGNIKPETPYIALEHMPRNCIALSDWDRANGLASGKFGFQERDLLFGKLRPYFHKVGVAPLDGVCSTDIVVVSPKSKDWFGFTLGHLSSAEFVEYTDAASTGTRMPRTNWADMAAYKVQLPGGELAKAFTRVVQPWVDRIGSSIHDSHSLAVQRDALLPKLISGELRVDVSTRSVL